MTHTKEWIAVFQATLLLSFLPACTTLGPPTKEELRALDYGTCPRNYEAKINEDFKSSANSGELIIWSPQKFWYKAPPLEGGKLYAGYLIPVMVEQTRGSTPTAEMRLYGFLFKDDELVKKLNPTQMSRFGIQEDVGPIPKDERDWKEGYSTSNAAQLLVEY